MAEMIKLYTVTLPDGTTYEIADDAARKDIAELKGVVTGAMHFRGVTTTAITDGSATNPILINSESYTAVNGDVVLYGNSEFVFSDSDSKWHLFGEAGSFGALAFKDSASGDVEVSGTAAAQVFTGSEGDVNVSGTVAGVKVDKFTVTPAGTNAASAVTITPTTTDVTGITGVGSLPSKDADTFNQGTLPELKMEVTGNNLKFSFNQGTLPTYTEGEFHQGELPTMAASPVKAWTGYSEAVAAAQVFTGSDQDVTPTVNLADATVSASGKFTPEGTNAESGVTANGSVTVE